MPKPKPKSDESKQEFIERFVSNERMKKEFKNKDKRLAVAYNTYKKYKKKK